MRPDSGSARVLGHDVAREPAVRSKVSLTGQAAPVVGALLGDVLRYSVAALVVIGLGVILGFRPAAGIIGVFLVALVLVFAFSVLWISCRPPPPSQPSARRDA